MKVETRINLGDSVTDVLNDHKGVVTCCQISINGCIQFLVETKVTKKDPKPDDFWLDEERLKVTKKSSYKKEITKSPAGGLKRRA